MCQATRTGFNSSSCAGNATRWGRALPSWGSPGHHPPLPMGTPSPFPSSTTHGSNWRTRSSTACPGGTVVNERNSSASVGLDEGLWQTSRCPPKNDPGGTGETGSSEVAPEVGRGLSSPTAVTRPKPKRVSNNVPQLGGGRTGAHTCRNSNCTLRWVSFYVNYLSKVYRMSTDQKRSTEILGTEVWTHRFFYVYLGIKKNFQSYKLTLDTGLNCVGPLTRGFCFSVVNRTVLQIRGWLNPNAREPWIQGTVDAGCWL